METALQSPTVQLVLLAIMLSMVVSVFRRIGRQKIDPQQGTGEVLIDGTKNVYRRRKGILGYFDWGKAHWLWATVIAGGLYFLPANEFTGELPIVVSPLMSVLLITLMSIGVHSATKNAGQSDPVQLVGSYFAKWFSKKMENIQ